MVKPKFSVIIPVKDREKAILETLNSVKSQTYKNFEVIIVDDASKDNTIKVAEKFGKDYKIKLKVISLEKSSGASKARNVGSENAIGEILVFTDSDIVLSHDVLERGLKYRKENPEISGFFGLFSEKLRYENFLSQYKHLYLCHLYSKQGEERSTFDTSLSFIDKKIFDKFKFNENIKYLGEDAELAMRMIKEGHVIKQVPTIRMEHLKKYNFTGFVKSEYARAKQFTKLLFKAVLKDKKESGKSTFYLKPLNIYLNVALMPFLILFLVLALIFNSLALTFSASAIFFILIILNLDFWNYLRKRKGFVFAVKAFFVSFFDMIVMDLGIMVATTIFIMKDKFD